MKETILFFLHQEDNKSGKDWKKYTVNQLQEWKVKYHELIMGKPQFDLMVDDRVINNKAWYEEHSIDLNE